MKYNKDLHGLMKLLSMVDHSSIMSININDNNTDYVVAFTHNSNSGNVFHVINSVYGKHDERMYIQDRMFIVDHLLNLFNKTDYPATHSALSAVRTVYGETRFDKGLFNKVIDGIAEADKNFVLATLETNGNIPTHGYADMCNGLLNVLASDNVNIFGTTDNITHRNNDVTPFYQDYTQIYSNTEFTPIDEFEKIYPISLDLISENDNTL